MPTFIQRCPANPSATISFTLALTAEQRSRSRSRHETDSGEAIVLQLPRGTILQDGDLLISEQRDWLQIVAKPEPVLTVRGQTSLDLLRAAYHLGNRHVPLEITPECLRLAPDPVLKAMLEHLGLVVKEEICSFQPEAGAYGHQH